ncbi:hypothetical protein OIDMADRAFT_186009 [Oidiodendron maius Zn]|uniref:Mitochondrial carrier protein n=1 Tax=Oidiodendron maius (strain Zn) TaxID=913774 RepID=A0A0C3D7T3_OIDMZ|nr:hypothetical protein OIDMADRAFT_186009 [Oidiodendron maius Zn]
MPTSTPIGPALPALGHAIAGATGTAISNLSIYPLDLIITRLQVQRQLRKSSSTSDEVEYDGVLDAFDKIYNREGGITAFYSGLLADTGKSIADSFLFFLFYNYLRTKRLKAHSKSAKTLPVLDELGLGALAGAMSKFFTTPISNIVTRKQTASMVSARSKSKSDEPSVSEIASAIKSEKGIQGFWSGYSASLILTLNPSITFFLYEFFKRYLLPRSRRDDPGVRVTFLMAAVSKGFASTITYPFSLAKARAQASSGARKDSKRATVFTTVLEIYRRDGPAALYEGVFGEILKGFFSHGITMIIKEAIHKLIVHAYYLLLKALNKYPSPAELAAQAGEAIRDGAEKLGESVREGVENVAERVGDNSSKMSNTINGLRGEKAGNPLDSAREYLGYKIETAGKTIKGVK